MYSIPSAEPIPSTIGDRRPLACKLFVAEVTRTCQYRRACCRWLVCRENWKPIMRYESSLGSGGAFRSLARASAIVFKSACSLRASRISVPSRPVKAKRDLFTYT